MTSDEPNESSPLILDAARKVEPARSGARLRRIGYLFVACATVAGALIGVRHAARRPPSYRADCLLQYGREPVFSTEGSAQPSRTTSEEWYQTQALILTSRSVAKRVFASYDWQRDPAYARVPRAAREELAVERLHEQLEVARVEGTRVVRITVRDADARRAAQLANAVAAAYLREAFERRTLASQSSAAWVSAEMASARERLTRTEDELRTLLEKPDAPALPLAQRQKMLGDELQRVQDELLTARIKRIELAAQVAKLKAASQQPNPFDVHAPEVDQDPIASKLREQYFALKLHQHELEAAQGPGRPGPALAIAEAKLGGLWDDMQRTIAGLLRGAQAELSAVQQVETQLQSTLERATEVGRDLQRQELAFGSLERERSEAERMLGALAKSASERGGSEPALNGSVLEPALAPKSPAPTPWPRDAALGAAAAAALAGSLCALWALLAARRQRAADAVPVSSRGLA